MKRLSIISMVAMFVILFGSASRATEGFTNYQITEVENDYVGKDVEKVWSLSYGDDEVPVTVVKQATKKGARYVVFSEYFEVNYVCCKSGFGVQKVRKSWNDIPDQINSAVLNESALKQQRILTPNQVNDEKALGLIASYLPALLNENYTHLLN